MVLKIQLKKPLEVIELHKTIDQENTSFKSWRRAHLHGPTWTVPSSHVCWEQRALLCPAGTGQLTSSPPLQEAGGSFPYQPLQPPRLWMRNRKLGEPHSAAQTNCALSFLIPSATLESPHTFEEGWRWTQSSNLPPLQQQERGCTSLRSFSKRRAGAERNRTAGKGQMWAMIIHLCQMLLITAAIKS